VMNNTVLLFSQYERHYHYTNIVKQALLRS